MLFQDQLQNRKQQILEDILIESSENTEIGNKQKSNAEIVLHHNSDDAEIDSRNLNLISDGKIQVETQNDIQHRTVAV